MSATTKNPTSLVKKDLSTQKAPGLMQSKVEFAHQANAGETGIDLMNLTRPTDFGDFVNPSGAVLSSAALRANPANLKVVSSLRGELMRYLAYRITSNTRIEFRDFTAAQDEVFLGTVEPVQRSGVQAIDGQALVATGVLLAGETDINVGKPFRINRYSTEQVGEVRLMYGAKPSLVFRNPGNGASGGNYQEIEAGDGWGALLRMNEAPTQDTPWAVFSNGLIIERPATGWESRQEVLQGQIDQMVPVLAAISDLDTSYFDGVPNDLNLKQFGDQVAKNRINHGLFNALRAEEINTSSIGTPALTPGGGVGVGSADFVRYQFTPEVGYAYVWTVSTTMFGLGNGAFIHALFYLRDSTVDDHPTDGRFFKAEIDNQPHGSYPVKMAFNKTWFFVGDGVERNLRVTVHNGSWSGSNADSGDHYSRILKIPIYIPGLSLTP